VSLNLSVLVDLRSNLRSKARSGSGEFLGTKIKVSGRLSGKAQFDDRAGQPAIEYSSRTGPIVGWVAEQLGVR
jgi:hypothetical protein